MRSLSEVLTRESSMDSTHTFASSISCLEYQTELSWELEIALWVLRHAAYPFACLPVLRELCPQVLSSSLGFRCWGSTSRWIWRFLMREMKSCCLIFVSLLSLYKLSREWEHTHPEASGALPPPATEKRSAWIFCFSCHGCNCSWVFNDNKTSHGLWHNERQDCS